MSNTATTETNIQFISTLELAAKLIRNDRFEFWNVLTSEYYSRENIAGSRHVPLDRVGRETANLELPADAEIVVYCGGPDCPQSHIAAEKLQALGYKNVKTYAGGLEEWETAGLPIRRDTETEQEASALAEKINGAACH